MKRAIMLIGFIIPFTTEAQVKNFESYPIYTGNDLGLMYTPQQSTFRIWAPTAEKAELILYKEGTGGAIMQTVSMQKNKSGTWITLFSEYLHIIFPLTFEFNPKEYDYSLIQCSTGMECSWHVFHHNGKTYEIESSNRINSRYGLPMSSVYTHVKKRRE